LNATIQASEGAGQVPVLPGHGVRVRGDVFADEPRIAGASPQGRGGRPQLSEPFPPGNKCISPIRFRAGASSSMKDLDYTGHPNENSRRAREIPRDATYCTTSVNGIE
jgi:hypothetical protein